MTNATGYEVYIAAGWFNPVQAADLDAIRSHLTEQGVSFYDPQSMCLCPPDAGHDFATYVLNENKQQIANAGAVLANIRHRDLGTVWEVGYALGLGKSVGFWNASNDSAIAADIEALKAADLDCESDLVVCDTTGKDPVQVARAGYAAAKDKRVLYYAPGLPDGASVNLMLAKSGIAVCTEADDLAACLKAAKADSSWSRAYSGRPIE